MTSDEMWIENSLRNLPALCAEIKRLSQENDKLRAAKPEVVRGKWVFNGDDFIPYCNQCEFPQDAPTNFCPNCGADMREVEYETD